jgi:putative DNA primase/helicase
MNALHHQKNIGVEETVSDISQETGSKASDTSLAVFPTSIDDTINRIARFMTDFYAVNNGNISFERIVAYNEMMDPKLGDGELEELYNRTKKVIANDNLDAILQTFKSNKTEATYLMAEHIVKKFNIITIGEKEREMFIYKDGMYYPGAENLIIYPEIQKILGCQVTKNAKTETFHKIADMTSHPRSVFSATPLRYIPLKNGVFDFETKKLLPHSPDYHFTYQFPIVYDPNASCPKTEAMLDQLLSPEQRKIMEEWIGFYFWRNYMYKKAIIFVGSGDTGKTTLLEVITHLLGRDNISSISLQKMTGDKFSAAHLYEKHGNLVDELSAKDISDTGAFKMATGGGSVTGEYKFGNQFSFQNFSKFTFACNRIPDVGDTNDEAYFNRWMVIRFENIITNKIPNFIETVSTEEERSGLFNIAMIALERLIKQKQFSYNNTAEETRVEMMRSGSSIAMFASEMLEREDGFEMTKEDMYDAYVAYCQQNKMSTQTKDMLGKKLGDYTNFLADGVITGLNGRGKPAQVRGWRNAKIRGQAITKADEEFKNF